MILFNRKSTPQFEEKDCLVYRHDGEVEITKIRYYKAGAVIVRVGSRWYGVKADGTFVNGDSYYTKWELI